MTEMIPLIEKYKPTCFEELYGHKRIIEDLKKWLSTKYLPNLLFYGPEGTGKSLITNLLAKEYLGKNYTNRLIMTVDASTNNTADYARDVISEFLKYGSPRKDLKRILILEEVDNYPKTTQKILRRPIDKASKSCIIIMTCNYINRLIKPFRDRFTEYYIGGISKVEFSSMMYRLLSNENITIENDTEEIIDRVYKYTHGQPRTMLNKIMEISRIRREISHNLINEVISEDYTFAKHLFAGDVDKAISSAFSDPKGSITGAVNYVLDNKTLGLSYSGKVKLLKLLGNTLERMDGSLPLSTFLVITAHEINHLMMKSKKKNN